MSKNNKQNLNEIKSYNKQIELIKRNKLIQKSSKWDDFRIKKQNAVNDYILIKRRQLKIKTLVILTFMNIIISNLREGIRIYKYNLVVKFRSLVLVFKSK